MTTIEFSTLKKYGAIIGGLLGIQCRIYDRDQAEASAKYLQYGCPGCTVADRECYATHLSATQQTQRELGTFQYMCPKGLSFIAVDFYIRSVPIGCMILGPFKIAYNDQESDEGFPVLRSSQYNNLQTLMREMVSLYNASSYSTSTDLSVDVLPDVSFRPIIEGYSEYSYELENQLTKMVGSGFADQTKSIITQLVENLFTVTGRDASEVRKRVEEIAYLISRSAISKGSSMPGCFQRINAYHSEVKRLKKESDFIAFLTEVVDFFSNMRKAYPDMDDKSNVIIKKAREFISRHYAEKITLDQTATYCQISQSYLGGILTSKLGYTFTQYVNFIRIEHSKELLANTEEPVSAIAEKCGFAGQSYFTQVFKTFVGKNPCDYRREQAR